MQVMGVYDKSLLESMAHVLSNLGVRKGMVVYGQEKLGWSDFLLEIGKA